jgi:hypothetical protein
MAAFWDVTPCGLVNTNISEESAASCFWVDENGDERFLQNRTERRAMTFRKAHPCYVHHVY